MTKQKKIRKSKKSLVVKKNCLNHLLIYIVKKAIRTKIVFVLTISRKIYQYHTKIIITTLTILITPVTVRANDTCDCNNSNIYERPYSLMENCPSNELYIHVGVFVGGAVVGLGLLYLMPESVTKWDKDSFTLDNIVGRWVDNVTTAPVVDDDTWFMNYVTHPYWGAVYYIDARSVGYNAASSFLYSVAISTFLWEYGFEALAEKPSLQDLIITPVVGSVLGEAFYIAKREIINNNYKVWGSKVLGHTFTFLMDPINELMDLISGKKVNNNLYIVISPGVVSNEKGFTLFLQYRF